MKKQLLFFLLLIVGIGNAQIVDIPDAEFKQYLLSAEGKDSDGNTILINANEDGEIQVSEAEAIWELTLDLNSSVGYDSFIGLEAFINLRYLKISGVYTTSVTENFNITPMTFLETLSLQDLYSINIQMDDNMPSLENLYFDYIADVNIDYSKMSNLKSIYESGSSITINTEQLSETIETINLTGIDVIIQPNNTFDFTAFPNLETFNSNSFYLDYIVLGNQSNLKNLDADLSGNEVTIIDFSGCSALENLEISTSSPEATFCNLKNGITEYETFDLNLYSSSNSPVYVCIDSGNENLFTESQLSDPNIYISSYCSFTPGGNYNTISGNFTFDGDSNGCDIDDNLIPLVKVTVDDGVESSSTFSNINGVYNFYTETGTFTLTPEFENSDWFTIIPSTATVTFEDNNNNVENQNFCITANGEHPDVEVVIVPIVPAQPGFNAVYKITYRNKGNQTLSGGVLLNYDDTVLDYVSSTSGVSVAENTFGWGYTDLQPFETRTINLTLNVNSPAEDPAVNIDDVLAFTATIYPDTDETPEDNIFELNQTVVGSYDPNDIVCLEGETVHMSRIGEYLHYNVNFENTGTAPATFVVVKDVINEEQFDISTLQLIDASHTVQTKIEGNTVEFYFGDINLAANGGKGNVVFKIKTLETLEAEDVVTQQANIFFDYNLPIVTNEANTTFTTLNNTVFVKDTTVKLYPNPTTDIVNISAQRLIKALELYDIQGRLLQVNTTNDTRTTIDLSSQPSGLYFVKVITEEGSVVEKLVKQ